jgi:hypothetical protein
MHLGWQVRRYRRGEEADALPSGLDLSDGGLLGSQSLWGGGPGRLRDDRREVQVRLEGMAGRAWWGRAWWGGVVVGWGPGTALGGTGAGWGRRLQAAAVAWEWWSKVVWGAS